MTRVPAKEPIFIVGYMHSGTTLLQNAVSRHSSVYSTRGETKYFDFLPMIATRYRDLTSDAVLHQLVRFTAGVVRMGYSMNADVKPGSSVADLSDDAVSAICSALTVREYPQVFAAVMDYLAGCEGKIRWLEKTPTHIFSIDRIATSIPTARFVEIVRDPRDVLASKKTRRETVWTTRRYEEKQRSWKNLEKAYDPLWDALSWKAAAQAGISAGRKYSGRIHRIRYEDLVGDPDRELSALCEFLGMPFEPGMLDVPAGQPAEVESAVRGRGFASDSVARWSKVMPVDEVALVQAVTSSQMSTLKYAPHPVGKWALIGSVRLVARSGVEFFDRLRRRSRMGGRQYLSLVVGNYFRRAAYLIGRR